MNIQNIQNIQAYRANAARPSGKKAKAFPDALRRSVSDTYLPSADVDRAQFLEAIKKRVKSGYYNSNEVVDDLSSSFARALNQDF